MRNDDGRKANTNKKWQKGVYRANEIMKKINKTLPLLS